MPQMARHISTGIALLISKTEPLYSLDGLHRGFFCYSLKMFSTGAKEMLSIPNLHTGQIQTQLPSMNFLSINFSSIFMSLPFTQAIVPQHWHLKQTANFSFSLQVRLSSEVLSFMFFLSPLCGRSGYTGVFYFNFRTQFLSIFFSRRFWKSNIANCLSPSLIVRAFSIAFCFSVHIWMKGIHTLVMNAAPIYTSLT